MFRPVCFRLPARLVFAAMRFVTQLLQRLYRSFGHKSRYVVRNGQEVREIGGPLGAATPLLPHQLLSRLINPPARPTLLIEPAASQSPAEIDCAAVSITSDSYTLPPPSSLLRGVQLPRSGPCWLFICYGLFSFEPE